MEPEVTNKLCKALGQELSEAQVVHILVLIRKLLGHRKNATTFFHLQFFSDWALHVRVDRAGARRILHQFDQWLPALLANENRAADGLRFLLLFGFHLEFQQFMREVSLPEPTNGWWCEFVRVYLDVIADCPASSKTDLGLKHVKELAVERLTNQETISYCWRITLRAGDIRRLPLDPRDFFNVNPTHAGEPWLWKGPVAAIVGLPEGWMTDNEPARDYQFCMYPVLDTRESAIRHGVFLYGNIVLKSVQEPTMEAIAERHECEIMKKVPSAVFQLLGSIEDEIRSEGMYPKSLLRVGNISPSYGGPEYSAYIDSPKGVLLLVMMCPQGKDAVYLPVLRWIAGTVLMMTRDESP